MDRRKLFFGLAIVFAVAGVAMLVAPQTFFGSGTFYDQNFGLISSVRVGSLVLSGIFAAFGAAVRR